MSALSQEQIETFQRDGVVLLAARNATGTAKIKEKIVPSVAMFSVSQIG